MVEDLIVGRPLRADEAGGIYFKTIDMHQALEHLRSDGHAVSPEDVARLSPLEHGHFNFLGIYRFRLSRG